MTLKASVYVTEDLGYSYKARITFSSESLSGAKPLDISCTLTRGRHDLKAYAGGRALHLDEETRELFEHLVLTGAQKIVKTRVNVVREQCGGRLCDDADDGVGVYANRQYSGHVDTRIAEVPGYMSRVMRLVTVQS